MHYSGGAFSSLDSVGARRIPLLLISLCADGGAESRCLLMITCRAVRNRGWSRAHGGEHADKLGSPAGRPARRLAGIERRRESEAVRVRYARVVVVDAACVDGDHWTKELEPDGREDNNSMCGDGPMTGEEDAPWNGLDRRP